jgi:hypothetical protein
VEPTKVAAHHTATALAEQIQEDDPNCIAIATLAATRLGDAHPLVSTLRRGVGFHHSALPDDIQAELEDGLRIIARFIALLCGPSAKCQEDRMLHVANALMGRPLTREQLGRAMDVTGVATLLAFLAFGGRATEKCNESRYTLQLILLVGMKTRLSPHAIVTWSPT